MIRSSGKLNVNISELRHRVTIQKFKTVQDNDGFETEQWTDVRTVWAKIENLYGKEYYAAAAVQAERTVKFVIRYMKDIDERMQIKFGKKTINIVDENGAVIGSEEVDKVYDIKFIDNIKYSNRFMEIQAMEVVVGG